MACFHPLDAWQLDSGAIVFAERGSILRALKLPCGRCIGCRLKRARSWAARCVHEAQMHQASIFATFTYEETGPSLRYEDFQRFLKRLRRGRSGIRFFAAGEYGELTLRPHYHALIFGHWPADARRAGRLWVSSELERTWGHGQVRFGTVTPESAGYCAKYSVKKVTGAPSKAFYQRVDGSTGEIVDCVPEHAHMSLRPGIGYTWFQKYWRDCYASRDGVVLQGRTYPAPRYYDRLLERIDADLRDDKEYDRYVNSQRFLDDCTPERLRDREAVAEAGFSMRRRDVT